MTDKRGVRHNKLYQSSYDNQFNTAQRIQIYSMENQESVQNWPKMDLVDGEVKTYFQLTKNNMYTQDYSFNISILVSIFNALANLSSLTLFSTLIITIVLPEASPYAIGMYATLLALDFLSHIIKQILVTKTKVDSDQRINKRTAKVYRGNSEFEKLEWGNIQQGDIVYLCQGDIAPADIIILDSQQIQNRQAITYVDVKNINGETVCEKKKSCYLTQILNRSSTQKRVWQEYKKIITGRITYEKASLSMDSFTGYLKLTKDPKVQKLSIQNLVLRESTIKTSLWVYGLVVYPGMDSKVMRSFKQGNKCRKWKITNQHKIFVILLVLNIILGLVFSFLHLYMQIYQTNHTVVISYHFLMFSIMLPHLRFMAKDISLILLRCSKKIVQIQIRDYQNIKDMGELNFVVISNVGVLTTGKLQVNQIVTQSSIYDFQGDDDNFQFKQCPRNSGNNRRRLGSSVKNETPPIVKPSKQVKINNKFLLPIMNYDKRASAMVFKQEDGLIPDENFEIDDDTNVRLRQSPNLSAKSSKLNAHLQPLKLDKNRFYNYVKRNQNQSTEIIKALALCHQAKLYYISSKSKYQGVSNVHSEEVLLKLVNYVGWNITPKALDKKQVGLIITEEKQKMNQENGLCNFETVKNTYNWGGINSFNINRKLFSVVVTLQNKHTLYCKGKPQDIIERLRLSKETQKIIEQTISSYDKKQSEVIIYAKRQLSQDQKQIYQNDYISLKSSLTTSESEIEEFSKKYEKNLQFICIIGMSTQMNPEAEFFIKNIRQFDIKPCIFVHQKSETTLVKKMILKQNEKYKDIEIEGQSAQLIRYYLNEATNLINNNENFKYILTLNGRAWKVIQSNSQIMQHFMFVLYYSQALLAIKFKPQHIRELTHKIRNSYPEQQKVLGVGYSYSDLKFLGESDISISTSQDLPTDIRVDSLQKITQTLKLGPYFLKAKIAISTLVYYRIIVISTITLIYQILMACLGTSRTINGHLVFLYLVISSCLQLIYIALNLRNPTKLQNLKAYKQFDNLKTEHQIQYIQAFIHGFVITFAIFFNLSQTKISSGKNVPIQGFDLSVFITIILVGSLRNFLNQAFSKLTALITTFITVSLMSLFVYLTSLANLKFYKVYSQFYPIVTTYDSLISIINTTLFCLCLSFFLQEIIKKIVIRQKCKKMVKITDQTKRQLRKKMIETICHLYKEEQNMQSSIQEIASSELDINKLKINKFLQIKREEENIKFLSQRLPKNRQIFTKVSIILALFFLTIFLVDLLNEEKSFQIYLLTCILGFALCTISSIIFMCKYEMFMCSYRLISVLMVTLTGLLLVYQFYKSQSHNLLLVCLISVLITQSLDTHIFVQYFLIFTIIVVGIVLSALKSTVTVNKLMDPFLEILCIGFNFMQFYQMEQAKRISFVKTQTFLKQSNYVNDIFSILVPKFIKNHLEGNEFSLQQQQKKVSILFCYVCNFDQIVKEEGTNVVPLMDQLFRQFDQLCHNFAVQKIQTVGQTYMAATGIKAYEDQIETEMKKRNQVERLLKMGIQMLQKSKDIMWGTKKNKKLNIKIGIHHGNVIIGVIGFHKPQFSLIGDAVNTTSRHCSTAAPGQIVVSYVAYELLRKFPASAFTKSSKDMKGLGVVPIYKYNNNLIKEQSHMKMRIRFQNAVRKLIQILKAEGKIQYKKFKASQLAQRVMLHERLNTKKVTRLSEPRRTIEVQSLQIHDKALVSKEQKYGQLCIQYNKLMELEGKNSKFKKHLITKHSWEDRRNLLLLALIYVIQFVSDLILKKYDIQSLALCSIGLVMFPIMIILYKNTLKYCSFNIIYVILHAYLILAINMKQIINGKQAGEETIMSHLGQYYSIMAIIICSSQKAFRLIHTAALAAFALAVSIVVICRANSFDCSIVEQLFIFLMVLIRKNSYMNQYYDNYNQSQIDEKKTQQQYALVSQLLPKHAYEKLKNQNIQNKLELTDRFEGATILFADIKGFTSYSNKNTPAAVVKMLRQLFEQFDKLCLKYNVYKVYTIGDCYVVLGFTNCYQRDYLQQAKNVVNMGLAMVETIQRVRQSLDFADLDMRIGIHTGTIIGGIIGTQIVRYDIYGPDVMVANKFQEYGKTGYIHISQSTKQILDQDKKKSFNIVPNKTVKVEKLNAEYNGYILTKKKFQI